MRKTSKNKIILCILDGWGLGAKNSTNAIFQAKTLNFDSLFKKYSKTELLASGNNVGLPEGQFGNSEVGHMNIGAGRIILQDILRISDSLKSGKMNKNEKISKLKKECKRIHLLGLISDGGVHGHQEHLLSLIDILCNDSNEILIHCILDGRDSPPMNGINNMKVLLEKIKGKENVKIATISGRYYVMDRDNRWDRINLAYSSIIEASSNPSFSDPLSAIKESYSKSLTDEFFLPSKNKKYFGVEDQDGFLITNYRADRVREFLSSIVEKDFDEFDRKIIPSFTKVLGLVQYSNRLKKNMESIFEPQKIKNTLGEVLSVNNLNQLRISETEKYAHVTYFFNGGVEEKFSRENRILISSPRVDTYDKKPEMSSVEMTQKLMNEINNNIYEFILVNYPNTDMVGHTGDMNATIKAVESVDQCIGRLYNISKKNGYILILTSDHGNADQMYDKKSKLGCTTHSLNPVPFIICSKEKFELSKGILSDIAPTILSLMNISKPIEMSGKSLIK